MNVVVCGGNTGIKILIFIQSRFSLLKSVVKVELSCHSMVFVRAAIMNQKRKQNLKKKMFCAVNVVG